MTLLIREDTFTEEATRFYIAEAVLALSSIHEANFIHRDIKPDNLLIDAYGHLKLSDFGLCTGFDRMHQSSYYLKVLFFIDYWGTLKKYAQLLEGDPSVNLQTPMPVESPVTNIHLTYREKMATWRKNRRKLVRDYFSYFHSEVTLLVARPTPLSARPTISPPRSLHRAGTVSPATGGRWALSCLRCSLVRLPLAIFWVVVLNKPLCAPGYPVFCSESAHETCKKIMNWRETIKFPEDVELSPEAMSCIKMFCCDADHRLGKNGIEEIKAHPFFEGINWDNIRNERPPFVPELKGMADTTYFPVEEFEHGQAEGEHNLPEDNIPIEPGRLDYDIAFVGYTYKRYNYLMTHRNAI